MQKRLLELSLAQWELGNRLGVNDQTISWETGESDPYPKHYSFIVDFLADTEENNLLK